MNALWRRVHFLAGRSARWALGGLLVGLVLGCTLVATGVADQVPVFGSLVQNEVVRFICGGLVVVAIVLVILGSLEDGGGGCLGVIFWVVVCGGLFDRFASPVTSFVTGGLCGLVLGGGSVGLAAFLAHAVLLKTPADYPDVRVLVPLYYVLVATRAIAVVGLLTAAVWFGCEVVPSQRGADAPAFWDEFTRTNASGRRPVLWATVAAVACAGWAMEMSVLIRSVRGRMSDDERRRVG